MMKTIDTDALMAELHKRHISLLIKARQYPDYAILIGNYELIRIKDVKEALTIASER